jgi:hypothetical protein
MKSYGSLSYHQYCYTPFEGTMQGFNDEYEKLGTCDQLFEWLTELPEALKRVKDERRE